MSRLSSSTYSSSICFMVFLHFVMLLLLTTTTTSGKPASVSSQATTATPTPTPTPTSSNGMLHVSSYVNQKRTGGAREEFDFEQNEAEATNSAHVRQLFGSLLLLPGSGNKSLEVTLESDDEPVSERITLDELNLETASEQHEGATESADNWSRIKLAIPVLEPVKHLINAVGGGGVNDTHVRTNSHRLIGHHGVHHAPHTAGNVSSPAIETEEDRETAIDSTGFDVLETLGSAGTVLWGILQNLRKLFAASAGNASASSSGGGGN